MKFNCNKDLLNESVGFALKAVSPRSILAVIEGIYIKASEGAVTLIGNDLEIGIESTFKAQIVEEGEIVVNAKMFSDIIRKLPEGDVEVSVDANNLVTIACGYARFEILGMSAADFPQLPEVKAEDSVSVPKNQLKKMISGTVFSAGTSENKIVLTGCLLETDEQSIRMVAVDGYRLAMQIINTDTSLGKKSFIIPSKALNELNKIIKDDDHSISINYTSKHAVFLFDNCKMVTRLIEGEFVNYKQIIPQESKIKITSSAKILIDAVERAALVITSDATKSPLKLFIKDDNIRISCETSAGSAEENIQADTNGAELEIGFNHRFLLDALKVCDTDEIDLYLNGSTNPCLIKPSDGEGFLYLVLPVRLSA